MINPVILKPKSDPICNQRETTEERDELVRHLFYILCEQAQSACSLNNHEIRPCCIGFSGSARCTTAANLPSQEGKDMLVLALLTGSLGISLLF